MPSKRKESVSNTAKNPKQPARVKRAYLRRDALFKALANMEPVYIQLIRKRLPKEFLDLVDLQRADLMSTGNANTALNERIADVVVKIPFKTGKARLLVLIEQQTTGMVTPHRALDYQSRGLVKLEAAEKEYIPTLVCTITFYSGSIPEKQTRSVFDGFTPDQKALGQKMLGTICPVGLGEIADEQLDDGSMSGILEMLLKHRRGKPILSKLESWKETLQRIHQTPKGREFVETVFYYSFLAAPSAEKDRIMEVEGDYVQEEKNPEEEMTVAAALRREGRLEGEQLGVEKTALGMLQEGMSLEVIKRITDLSIERLRELAQKLEHKVATHKR